MLTGVELGMETFAVSVGIVQLPGSVVLSHPVLLLLTLERFTVETKAGQDAVHAADTGMETFVPGMRLVPLL